jgi:anti-anti-sigma factor
MSMLEQPAIALADDDSIKVSGCLDVTTVSRYKDAGIRLIDRATTPVFDLGGAEVNGSAAIALLIAWQRHANKVGKEISIINPPANLLDIARACGVSDIVPFSAST